MGEATKDWFHPFSITFSKRHLKYLYESAFLYAVFGYRDELFGRMLECSLQSDYPIINRLYCSTPLYVEMRRGMLNVRNYETEEENKWKEGEEGSTGYH